MSELKDDPHDRAAIARIRWAAHGAPPLGELSARGLARAALGEARRRALSRRRRALGLALSTVAVAAALVIACWPRTPEVPLALASRPAGRVVPGPFPKEQSPAERLDRIAEDRLIAWRSLALARLEER